ncbi:aminotransferase [Paenibacillus mendelii]|uniref:Aminotransferase n=1 Tax=Paenibacillus mendelii TaxID=206163 RepID=A0ABV6JCK9_9BACL|nr:aminotransferase [Paenibacillus mendelii]MCQ6561622.1 aminotransferase [Paenibacillus mendelii]
MKYRNDPSVSGFQQPFGGQSQFPGISDPFFNGGMGGTPTPFNPTLESNMPQIALQPATEVIPQAAADAAPAKAGGFSLANLGGGIKDLQGIVDRMGGIDGILSTMTKVQKVVGSVQQMAPLIKLLAGSFGKKGVAATASDDSDADGLPIPKRRKRRRTGSGSGSGSSRPRKRKRRR